MYTAQLHSEPIAGYFCICSCAAGDNVNTCALELLGLDACKGKSSNVSHDTMPVTLVPDAGLTWHAMLQGTVVAIENKQRRLYGLQYHPEVQHSERGIATLRRFLFGIAKMPADWKIENVLKEEMEKIRGLVRANPMLSTVPSSSTAPMTDYAV